MFTNIAHFSTSDVSPSQAYLSIMSDTDSVIRADIKTLIDGLVTDGIWDKLEYLGVIQNLEADTKKCLKRLATKFSWVSSTYTANQQVHIDSEGGGIYSGFDPDADATILSEDDFHFATYVKSTPTVTSQTYALGRWDYVTTVENLVCISYYTNCVYYGLRFDTSASATAVDGLWVISRESSTDLDGYSDTNTGNSTAARRGVFSEWSPTSETGRDMVHGAINSGDDDVLLGSLITDIPAWCGGSGLTATEVSNLRSRLETYLTARGAI